MIPSACDADASLRVQAEVAAFSRPFPPRKAPEEARLTAIHSKYLKTLEAVIATALNIVKNCPLADLYVRKDYMGQFRVRVQLESGNATSSQSKRTHDAPAMATL
jgi:hypothetical protein